MEEQFWLLDVNYEVKDHKSEVWMWGINRENRRILIIDRNFTAYFYLILDDGAEIEDVFGRLEKAKERLPYIVRLEATERRLFGKPVKAIKVYCQDPDLISKYAKDLSKIEGIKKSLEDDIRYSMRYLIDNDVIPSEWHRIEVEEFDGEVDVKADKVYLAISPPVRLEGRAPPNLKILAFSMLCYSSRGSPKPERDPIIILSLATSDGEKRNLISEDGTDRKIIKSFIEFIESFDPDVILGYGTNRADWQYLMERCRRLGIDFKVDRVGSTPHTSVYGHVSITGRINLDILDFADEFPEVKVKTLENMADYLGVMDLEKRVIIEEIDVPEYWNDTSKRSTLIRFVEENVECIIGIYNVLKDFIIQMSQLVGLPLDQIGRAAVGFRVEWYLIRNAYKLGELIPERIERPYIPYAGGMVLKPKPGIHENIAVLDFKSMYPNIMIEKNISPDTYIPPTEHIPESEVNVAPEVGHRFRKDPPGFYKRVLSNLIVIRDEIKDRLKSLSPETVEYHVLDARQKAVKILTNASYGYAGWIGARWYIKPVAEATTAWGREIIKETISIAKNVGLDVIYSDTDSIFIEYDEEKIRRLSEIVKERFNLEIKPDIVYTRILFTEAKKRYCGLLPDGRLDIVGLEVVRGDWARIAKEIQEKVLEIVLKEGSYIKAAEFVQEFITELRRRKVQLRDFVIWKTLTKPVEEYSVKTPHVEAAKMLRREGWDLTVGDKVGYVIVSGSGRLYERVKPYILASPEELDIEYYIRNQIVPAALRILSVFGLKEEDLLSPKKPKSLLDFIG